MKSLVIFCGLVLSVVTAEKSGRILGGQAAQLAGFPFMASLRTLQNEHFCGGWVHNNRWIITTAHCVRDRLPADVVLHLGTNSRTDEGIRHLVIRIEVHPEYNSNLVANNIAMLQTAGQITFTGLIQSAQLPVANTPGAIEVTIPGWGLTERVGNMSDTLQWITANTVTVDECRAAHTRMNQRFIYNNTICTRSPVGEGMCTGDGGGPLVIMQDAARIVVGAVSWSMPCGTGVPDVAVRIFSYIEWINNIVQTIN